MTYEQRRKLLIDDRLDDLANAIEGQVVMVLTEEQRAEMVTLIRKLACDVRYGHDMS